MKRLLSSIFILTIAFNACITITIDGTYNALTPEQKLHIKKFIPGQHLHDTTGSFTLYEIMPRQILQVAAQGPYTCVFIQTPHCHGPHCKPLSYYSRLLTSLDSLHVQTLLISPYYEYKIMQREKERFTYNGLMLVEDKQSYGKHKFNSHKLFIEQMLGHNVRGRDTLGYASYYLYKHDTLVSYGLEQMEAIDYLRKHL